MVGIIEWVEADELWREVYEGEVLGETLFSTLAAREQDTWRREQLEVLALLERSTKELAEPVLARRGITREADAARTGALSMADAVAGISWEQFLGSFQPVISEYLAKYRRLVTLAGDDDERAVAEAYVAHELALEAFLRRALGQEDGVAAEAILDLPHVAAASR